MVESPRAAGAAASRAASHASDSLTSALLSQEAHQSTVWAARHLPQNRDVFMTTGGNGSLELWKYSYPTQRKIKEKDGHEKGVLSLKLLGDRLFAGDRKGEIKLWKVSDGEVGRDRARSSCGT